MGKLRCDGCTACCKGEAIFLHQDKGDRVENYPNAVEWDVHPLTGQISPMLKRQEDGSCVYLGEKGCAIYETRPRICREFDCRRMVGLLHKPEWTKYRELGIDNAVIAAGKARLHTLKD